MLGTLIAAPECAAEAVEQAVAEEMRSVLPADDAAGAAVALQVGERTWFFSYGWADRAAGRGITADTLFNLASVGKVFDTTLLALAVQHGEVRLDDPVARHVSELQRGGDIRRVTLGQLATYTSGFTLPQDHPPWPEENFTWAKFVSVLNGWEADADHAPGRQVIYSHAGYMLLRVALERRFGAPFDQLLKQRVLAPLGLSSTMLPPPGAAFRGELPPELKRRAAQGYAFDGPPAGEPGEQQGFYHWPGTGQMYASARDMAAFLAANLSASTRGDPLGEALTLAQQEAFRIDPGASMALGWEILEFPEVTTIEKYGGLYNASAYIGMVRGRKIGVVILANRGDQDVANAGRRLLARLAGGGAEVKR